MINKHILIIQMAEFPREILLLIFNEIRLSTLLHWRQVNKDWRNLIDNHYQSVKINYKFIDNHISITICGILVDLMFSEETTQHCDKGELFNLCDHYKKFNNRKIVDFESIDFTTNEDYEDREKSSTIYIALSEDEFTIDCIEYDSIKLRIVAKNNKITILKLMNMFLEYFYN